MIVTIAERRQIENEMILRRANEKVGDALGGLDAMHIKDNNLELIRDDNSLLHFKCECAYENCDARIPLKLSVYQKIHENRDTFIVIPKHQVEPIEKLISAKAAYSVVKKNNSVAEP